ACQIASRTGRIAAIAILACAPMVAGFERGLGIHAVCFADSPMKALAARISKESQTGDILVIYPEFYATSFNWYYRVQLPVVCFPSLDRVELLDWNGLQSRLTDPTLPERAVEFVREKLRPGGRIWVIYNPSYKGARARMNYGDAFEHFLWKLDFAIPNR